MILKSRTYERVPPSRDAKLFIIYSEGKRREPDYFRYFQEISSRIKFEIIEAPQEGDNSPTGLLSKAIKELQPKEKNQIKYGYEKGQDSVWFVIDTDKWGEKIDTIRAEIEKYKNWFIAQSNPCFEVWLYYHIKNKRPVFENMAQSSKWKGFLNEIMPGGFDSRKHPILIEDAISNSKENYLESDEKLGLCSTEVYKLAESFYPYIEDVINKKKTEI